MYLNGEGVRCNYRKARELFNKSIELGNSDAYVSLGNIYLNGFGVEKDFRKALEYYSKASEKKF